MNAPKIGFHIVIIYQFEKETNNCVRYYGEKREKEVGECLQLCLGDVWSQVDILIKKNLSSAPVLPSLPELISILSVFNYLHVAFQLFNSPCLDT